MVLGFEIALFSICAVSTFNLCQVLYYLIALPTYVQYWQKELDILFCSITTTNLGQFSKPGTDLKSAGQNLVKLYM